jgi:hypothetical protein
VDRRLEGAGSGRVQCWWLRESKTVSRAPNKCLIPF